MNQRNNKHIHTFCLGLLLMITSSCGFHLRGNVELPEIYQHIYVMDKGASEISILLKQALINNQATLVDSAQSASAIITVYSQRVNRRAIAVRGKEIKEYEIQLNVSFAVQEASGKQQGKSQNISTIRRYSFNNDQVLGSNNEEQILIREMREDIVRQILKRLSKIN
ncbi:MAG: LPS assembly lipoprotein LptE [Pseudomonadota bacterium]